MACDLGKISMLLWTGHIIAVASIRRTTGEVAAVRWIDDTFNLYSLGYHRVVVSCNASVIGVANAVVVYPEWRRPDKNPAAHNAVVVAGDPTSNTTLKNVVAAQINRKDGAIVFQPKPTVSTYYLYWMPFTKNTKVSLNRHLHNHDLYIVT